MKNLAIIPARSGSKGIPDKNIRLLNGKPLLAYTVEAAIKSRLFGEIILSTDSEEYARIGREWGAEVPFLRSRINSSDTASSWDAAKEVLRGCRASGREYDTVALLQPTSPLRNHRDIINGYQLMEGKNANAVAGVCETEHSPLWCNTLPEDGSLKDFIRQDILCKPRQSLPRFYRLNGALYIVRAEDILSGVNIYRDGCYALIMPKERSVDIDLEIDFLVAGLLLSELEAI